MDWIFTSRDGAAVCEDAGMESGLEDASWEWMKEVLSRSEVFDVWWYVVGEGEVKGERWEVRVRSGRIACGSGGG